MARFAFAFLLFPAALLSAQPAHSTGSRPIPRAAIREDLAILLVALDSLHPGLHRYVTPSEVSASFQALERRLDRDAPLTDAFLAITEFLGRARDGHTFPNPVNQPDAVARSLFTSTPRVPFYFRWLDRRMIVTRDETGDRSFPPGTEVLEINGVAVSRILDSLLPYSRADGANDAKRIANLALRPAERFQAFDVYYPLLFRSLPPRWTVRVKRADNTTETIEADPVTLARRTAVFDSLRNAARDSTVPPWTFRIDDDPRIGVLTMPTWAAFDQAWNWRAFLDRAFAELAAREVPALVVDLRENEGGQDAIGHAILARLVDREVTIGALQRFTRYQRAPRALRPFLATWDRTFDDWSGVTTPSANRPGLYRLIRNAGDSAGTVIRPIAPRYAGRVFVLVGPVNSSATFLFAQAARERGLATLVGQPTGGNRRGITGGALYFLRLPNTGIAVDLPLIGYYPPGAERDAGIIPDLVVATTAADIAAGRDPELHAVRRALRRGAPPPP